MKNTTASRQPTFIEIPVGAPSGSDVMERTPQAPSACAGCLVKDCQTSRR